MSLLPVGIGSSGDYEISRSVRLRSSASAYFNRTPASAGNRQTWTWSGWIKRGTVSPRVTLFGFGTSAASGGSGGAVYFDSNTIYVVSGGGTATFLSTTPVYRDPSAWYHIVIAFDSTQATASNRIKIYVNGLQVTAFANTTYPSQNYNSDYNNTIAQYIGVRGDGGLDSYFDGYLTEINSIDGQALDPSYFGETDAVTGVWKPKKYTGTYGTNGFFLNFSDNSAATAAAIGKDYSGNGNNWTPNNISVTAGATYDSMLDVPTQWADGGNGRGNYAVINPLDSSSSSTTTTNGNLDTTITSSASIRGSFYVSSGKWYYEVTINTLQNLYLGLASNAGRPTNYTNTSAFGVNKDGNFFENDSVQTEDSIGLAAGATFGIAFDADAKKFWISKNGQWYSCDRTPDITISASDIEAGTYGYDFSSLTGDSFAPHFGNSTTAGAAVSANFGQRPFSYTPPTGFKALNTLNLPTPTILKGNQYFDVSLYSGNSSTQNITNSGAMQPDLVWTKSRSTAGTSHVLIDAVRGVNQALQSDLTNAEATFANSITAFNSDGFAIGSANQVNLSGRTYVGWQWKEGATQGFDIVTYTGNGSTQNVGHSLGVAPSMVIVKERTSTSGWFVYTSTTGAGNYLALNDTVASTVSTSVWNNTAPTSSVFSVGVNNGSNENTQNYIAYLFSEVAGFSKFGSYVGNGSTNGPMIFTGFLPRFVMWKRTNAVGDWLIEDSARDVGNAATAFLIPNKSNAEATGIPVDFLSNGFKIRTTNADTNTNGATYIYAAFAENPFKNSLAR